MTKFLAGICILSSLYAFQTQATIVEFSTSLGNIRVNLHDSSTPKTVENFLSYVNDGNYVDTIIHRVEPNFVVQGGGFQFSDGFEHLAIETKPSVENEPVWSNVEGTIAMAKVDGDENSATSQWFFNINNNAANLDLQNGGFTVFGQVIPEDMTVLTEIAELMRCNNAFGATPMVNYSVENCTNGDEPGYENFVVVYNITVVDSASVTDDNLTKTPNTLINMPTPEPEPKKSSGGSLAFYLLAMLALIRFRQ